MKKATKQMVENRQAGDPALVTPGIDEIGVPFELTKKSDPNTGELELTKPAATATGKAAMHRVSDVVESGFDEFYPGAPRVSIEDVMAWGDVVILDAVIIDNFETQYGSHPLALIAVIRDEESGEVSTFPSSGQVVVDKLRQLKAKHALPCLGAFVKDRRYYDLK